MRYLLLAAHLEGELGEMAFREGSSIAEIRLSARSPRFPFSVPRDRARGGDEAQRRGRGGEGRLWLFFRRGISRRR